MSDERESFLYQPELRTAFDFLLTNLQFERLFARDESRLISNDGLQFLIAHQCVGVAVSEQQLMSFRQGVFQLGPQLLNITHV
jgi:hypothetical protein